MIALTILHQLAIASTSNARLCLSVSTRRVLRLAACRLLRGVERLKVWKGVEKSSSSQRVRRRREVAPARSCGSESVAREPLPEEKLGRSSSSSSPSSPLLSGQLGSAALALLLSGCLERSRTEPTRSLLARRRRRRFDFCHSRSAFPRQSAASPKPSDRPGDHIRCCSTRS